jgi:hypothetical protein
VRTARLCTACQVNQGINRHSNLDEKNRREEQNQIEDFLGSHNFYSPSTTGLAGILAFARPVMFHVKHENGGTLIG